MEFLLLDGPPSPNVYHRPAIDVVNVVAEIQEVECLDVSLQSIPWQHKDAE